MQTLQNMPHIPQHIAKIVQQFADDSKQLLHDNVIGEYLFGSYATNTQTALSDIDILILVNANSGSSRLEPQCLV